MERQSRIDVRSGNPVMLGANKNIEGLNFAAEIPCGKEASLVLYRKGSKTPSREIPFREENRTGKVCSLLVCGLNTEQYEYNFRIDGRIVQDPFAHGIRGRERFGAAEETEDEHRVRCTFLPEKDYDWEGDVSPRIPYNEMILYKVHVRGYTRQQKLPAKLRGTFRGLQEMIPYWKDLGINAVELMPAYEFQEVPPSGPVSGLISEKRSAGRVNFWGYQGGFYFAPKRAYCATKEPENELRDLIRAMHKAGIECIMEFYFPEGMNRLMALRTAWFWKTYYHVDGFHFVGNGVPGALLAGDHILYGTKKLFQQYPEATENDGMSAECLTGFQQDMRRFLKSDEGMVSAAEYHIRHQRRDGGCINYMASQDGFTLYDTVSYNYRHNEANGEDNRDGSDYNYSWNCGIEGPTRRQVVKKMREQQMKNAFLMLLLSQGTPMIYGGDEFCNSQDGNNNAWCQDNPTGWTDWKALKKNEKLHAFVREAIAFRKAHPILHMPQEARGVDYLAKGFPDMSFHGERAWYLGTENTCRLVGTMYCGAYAQKPDGSEDDFIYTGYNFHWENRRIALPNLPDGMVWKKVADTSEKDEGTFFREREEVYEKSIEIAPRTVVVLIGRSAPERSRTGSKSSNVEKSIRGVSGNKMSHAVNSDGELTGDFKDAGGEKRAQEENTQECTDMRTKQKEGNVQEYTNMRMEHAQEEGNTQERTNMRVKHAQEGGNDGASVASL